MQKLFSIRVALFVLSLAMFAGTSAQTASPAPSPLFVKTNIWRPLEGGYLANHVHALTITKNGSLLAFSEGRVSPSDGDPSDLIAKRSTDMGETWSDDTLLERSDGMFYEGEGIEGRREAWVNPVAVSDKKTGRVFIFYALNEGSIQQTWTRVFYRYSDDDGQTWLPKKKDGGRIEITSLLKDNKNGWSLFMPGPGHGIQLEHQKGANASKNGRLLVQMWNRRALNQRPRNYGVVVIYSDDSGKTWKRGGETHREYGENESRLVEFSDGRILINARGSEGVDNAKGIDTRMGRMFAFSTDAGDTFSGSTYRPELNYRQIDSGAVRYVAPDGRECLVFSHPDDENTRTRLTVRATCDGLKTWQYKRLVDDGIVGYSDLVVLPDNTLGVLYGTRRPSDFPGTNMPTGVKFARFSFDWLTEPEAKK
jgi:Uncharacterized protein related to plant photosystem II stability/assembly factor